MGNISNRARNHSDANIALGPILKMYIPGQIRIFNALNSDGYSTSNALPSGNNKRYFSIGSDNGLAPTRQQAIIWTNDGKFIDAYMGHLASMS